MGLEFIATAKDIAGVNKADIIVLFRHAFGVGEQVR